MAKTDATDPPAISQHPLAYLLGLEGVALLRATTYDDGSNQLIDREGDIHELPRLAGSVDLVVCAAALSHFADLDCVLAELVRVLRPGGHLVLSDSRGLIGELDLPLVKRAPDGSFGYMPVWIPRTSDFDPPDVWALHPLVMAAANAAWRGTPAAIVLHFQRGTLMP